MLHNSIITSFTPVSEVPLWYHADLEKAISLIDIDRYQLIGHEHTKIFCLSSRMACTTRLGSVAQIHAMTSVPRNKVQGGVTRRNAVVKASFHGSLAIVQYTQTQRDWERNQVDFHLGVQRKWVPGLLVLVTQHRGVTGPLASC